MWRPSRTSRLTLCALLVSTPAVSACTREQSAAPVGRTAHTRLIAAQLAAHPTTVELNSSIRSAAEAVEASIPGNDSLFLLAIRKAGPERVYRFHVPGRLDLSPAIDNYIDAVDRAYPGYRAANAIAEAQFMAKNHDVEFRPRHATSSQPESVRLP